MNLDSAIWEIYLKMMYTISMSIIIYWGEDSSHINLIEKAVLYYMEWVTLVT